MRIKLILILVLPIFILASIYFFKQNNISQKNQDTELLTEQKYEKIKKISTEVDINYIDNLLGKPVYKKTYENETKSFTYVDPDYYVKIITDKDNSVLSYAITSRNEDFTPTFRYPEAIEVTLNKTKFSEWFKWDRTRNSCFWLIGAHPPNYYFEKEYLGNPGKYLTYWVGINSAGNYQEIPMPTLENPKSGYTDCQNINNEMRKNSSPNTFMVWAPFVDFEQNELLKNPDKHFGAHYTKVRTLNE
jgi:uncharacterized protein YxeA